MRRLVQVFDRLVQVFDVALHNVRTCFRHRYFSSSISGAHFVRVLSGVLVIQTVGKIIDFFAFTSMPRTNSSTFRHLPATVVLVALHRRATRKSNVASLRHTVHQLVNRLKRRQVLCYRPGPPLPTTAALLCTFWLVVLKPPTQVARRVVAVVYEVDHFSARR
jgi:hypothetical protein